jgi:hypothetical protein
MTGPAGRPTRAPGSRGATARGAARALVALAAAGVAAPACSRGTEPLGVPDSYIVFASLKDEAGQARKSPAGLPVVGAVALDDPRAALLERLFAVGFAGEVLRTDYLAKQFIREAQLQGKSAPADSKRAAAEPTILFLDRGAPPEGRGLSLKGAWGGTTDRPALPWVGIGDGATQEPSFVQTLSGLLGARVARLVSGAADGAASRNAAADRPEAAALIHGYARSLEVIAREWRVGEGPQGTMAPDAGTAAQRELFAGVRQNRYARGPDGHTVRPAAEMLADAGLVATVLYRFAQAKGIGNRVGPPELYAPFVTHRIPPGVSPAAVLGPFRNFQAKLIAAWGGSVLRGAPPRDLVDLVEAYARELPAERAEVIRLFVVTTWAATVKPGGVSPSSGGAAGPLAELTALAAEVTAGRRSLRSALSSGN